MSQLITTASIADLRYITTLAKKFTNELGFLSFEAVEQYMKRRGILLGRENGEPAGYILSRPMSPAHPATATIIQAAVQMDAQRRALGLRLVGSVSSAAAANGSRIIQCWCAADIEARTFWKAAGFTEVARRSPGNKRQRELILYRLALVPLRTGELYNLPAVAGQYNRTIEIPGQHQLFGGESTSRISLITCENQPTA